jgi:transcriptional regulator with XRE-family HTH domain
MPRRSVPVDPSIGERIRTRRELRRWSIRHAASRAGVAHTTWSRIERGELRTDRYMMADLAAALECSVTDLTGQPYLPADRALETAHAQVDQAWRAMMAHPLTEPPSSHGSRPFEVLVREAELVRDLYNRCDYAGALARLVDLVPELHCAAHGEHARLAMELMVPVYGVAMGALLNLGYPAHAWLAVERCVEAAQRLEDPVAMAVAACNSARVSASSGAYAPARSVCTRAADDLERHLAVPTALETLGFLHLARAHHTIGLKDRASAGDHFAEAARIAERTGETSSWDLVFGPNNVALWTMAAELDTGEPGKALETASRAHVSDLPPTRQVAFYIDMARGLADVRREQDALRMLLTAERTAPQHARSSTAARVVARSLLSQARRSAGGSELRGLCERMGVAD